MTEPTSTPVVEDDAVPARIALARLMLGIRTGAEHVAHYEDNAAPMWREALASADHALRVIGYETAMHDAAKQAALLQASNGTYRRLLDQRNEARAAARTAELEVRYAIERGAAYVVDQVDALLMKVSTGDLGYAALVDALADLVTHHRRPDTSVPDPERFAAEYQRSAYLAVPATVGITVTHEGGNTLRGPVEDVLRTHLAPGWRLTEVTTAPALSRQRDEVIEAVYAVLRSCEHEGRVLAAEVVDAIVVSRHAAGERTDWQQFAADLASGDRDRLIAHLPYWMRPDYQVVTDILTGNAPLDAQDGTVQA